MIKEILNMSQDYAAFFREHRIRSGFKSQRRLSDKSGLSQTTISRIERGDQKPTPETLKELAPYLTSTSYAEMLLACGYWDSDIKDDLQDIVHKQFFKKLDLTDENILEEFDIRIDGKSLSKENARKMIDYIRKIMDSKE